MIKTITIEENEQPILDVFGKKHLIPLLELDKFDVSTSKDIAYKHFNINEKATITYIIYRGNQFGIGIFKHGCCNSACYWEDKILN